METYQVKKGRRKYLCAGVRTDCQNIINKFSELGTMRYDTFTGLWRQLKFSYIYYGRGCLEELIEFTEEIFRIAKEMWLKSEALNEQAGGLYTLYGLYLKQPTNGWVKVRLTPSDYELMETFHVKIKSGDHFDANYVLARMHMIGAFRFCVSEYTYGIDRRSRRYHDKDESLREGKEEPTYVKHLKNDIFSQFDTALKQYHEAKCKMAQANSKEPPKLLSYIDPHFSQTLKEEFQEILQVHNDPSECQAESNNKQSNSKSKTDKNSPGGKISKLPWWLLPVRNRIRRESSSDSEQDDVAESTGQLFEKANLSGKKSKVILNAELGMSGDEAEEEEDDDDDDSNENSHDIFFPEPGCSHDMPLLF